MWMPRSNGCRPKRKRRFSCCTSYWNGLRTLCPSGNSVATLIIPSLAVSERSLCHQHDPGRSGLDCRGRPIELHQFLEGNSGTGESECGDHARDADRGNECRRECAHRVCLFRAAPAGSDLQPGLGGSLTRATSPSTAIS